MLDEAVQSMKRDGITAMGFQGDVRKMEDCNRWAAGCVDAFGALNIVVNCAAGNFLATAEELSSGGFRSVMEIDALGTFNMSRAAHGVLSKAKDACIINISATLHYGATWWQVLLLAPSRRLMSQQARVAPRPVRKGAFTCRYMHQQQRRQWTASRALWHWSGAVLASESMELHRAP